MIDDNHAIVASAMGPEYYVSVMSFVNRDLLEPGCSVLLHNKVHHKLEFFLTKQILIEVSLDILFFSPSLSHWLRN